MAPVRILLAVVAFAVLPATAAPGASLPGPRLPNSVAGDFAEREIRFQVALSMWVIAPSTRRSGFYGAYEQRSLWNLDETPEPFRTENDFRPEVGAALGPDLGRELTGAWPEWLTLSSAFVHESNGLEGDLSRSWNRVLGTVHYGGPDARLRASVSGWVAFRVEDTTEDITDHAGVGELRVDVDLPALPERSTLRLRSAFSPDAASDLFFTNLDAGLHVRPSFLPDWMVPDDDGPAVDLMLEVFLGSGEFLYDFEESTPRVWVGLALRTQGPDRNRRRSRAGRSSRCSRGPCGPR